MEPDCSNYEAQTTFGAVRPSSDLTPNFNSKQKIPSTSYGVPVTATPYRTINEPQLAHNQNNRPSSQYGAVNTDETNIETLEQIKQLNLLLQLSQSGKSNRNNPNLFQNQESSKNVVIPSQQYLPVKEPTNFRKGFDLSSNQGGSYDVGLSNRNGNQQPSDHYLPANQVSNSNFPQIPAQNRNTNTALPGSQNINPNLNGFNSPAQNIEIERLNVRRLPNLNSNEQNQNRAQSTLNSVRQNKDLGYTQNGEQIGEGYLPPALPAPTTRPTIYRPATSRPASVPSDGPAGNDQPTVFKDAAGPNVSVATAVAGTPGEQRFYVLQPDGSLQRVIFQKTRTDSDRENEYTANYIFQNVQPDPELGYK
ncbi:hypothetical protein NQ315_004141 [Exocentrus adspersus]|uniref:Uncharacterized protein n=1 Tax=Exocentrus adspersus TaxID=1586481 RepID=A0AAV8W6W3_9CUCU|nr:hypothetical protein NQ315_004141 [Exocentrus adspersus]